MTEDEAKTKWCPFARPVVGVPKGIGSTITGNRIGSDISGSLCIASACMQWRWSEEEDHLQNTYDDNGNWAGRQQIAFGKDRQGHCGLAGKP
jgi:hypothetical protein